MKNLTFLFFVVLFVNTLISQQNNLNTITIYSDSGRYQISKHIYGHFAEHLGKLIYGGIWVGENSSIPNKNGIRTDIVEALKKIKIPNLRWPGGCFADEYHWKDGIGPRNERPKMVNTNWGGVIEDNSFGTHEFMDLIDQLGCEPVICGNIGSGTVEEMADWVEYLTADNESPMSLLRKKNGREEPWEVKFWGVGNETWGCGGIMSADFYSEQMARYSHFLKNYGDNVLYKIAASGLEEDLNWTETIMKKWSNTQGWLQGYMSGYSLHYYTVTHDWTNKGSATEFNEEEWFTTIFKTKRMNELIINQSKVMDKYDPEKRIGLIVDEYGAWHDVEPGTNPGFLYQQNSLRDAMVAALNLDIFNNHCDRVKMANIAQVVNVLQALILTDEEKMILTPTYHVFDLYKVHHDATLIPIEINSEIHEMNDQTTPAISGSASMSPDSSINLSLVNVNPVKSIVVSCPLKDFKVNEITGQILTSEKMQDHNTFEQPDSVRIKDFNQFKIDEDRIIIEMPSKSIVVLKIK
jgi:alpha-L-arabinofuranosidase